jgi:hypothetical protein
MQIKTLSFWISNSETKYKTTNSEWYTEEYDNPKTTSFEEIDKQINDFLDTHIVQDIKINDDVVEQHNNGRSDTILRTYTIMYS